MTIFIFVGTPAIGDEKKPEENEKELQKLLSGKEGPAMVAVVQLILWRAGYFELPPITGKIDEDTKKALRNYQKHRELSITEKLDVQTFEQIFKDADLMDPGPIGVTGYSFSDYFWNSIFSADGTWVFEDSNEKMADPIQATEIKCYRDMGLCIEATAFISFDHALLNVVSEIFEVERWDEYEIVTKPHDFHCTRYVIRINRQQQSVKKLRSTLRTKELCKGLDIEDKYIKLINGFDEWWDFKQKFYERRNKIYSPSFTKHLERIESSNK
jgi:hypothetical protein